MITFEQIFPELQPKLKSLDDQRIELLRLRRKTLLIIVGIILPLTILALVISRHPLALFIGIGVGGIVYSTMYEKHRRKFKNEVKDKLILQIVNSMNMGLTYRRSSFISVNEFRKCGIYQQSIDKYWGEDFFEGKVGETDVLFSELTAQSKKTVRDSKGNVHTHYVTFFQGLFVIADFHKNFSGRTLVLPDNSEQFLGMIGKKLQSMNFTRDELVYMENPEFEKKFVVYSTDQVEARYILSLTMLERIMMLSEKLDSRISLSFADNKVYIAIPQSKDFLEHNLNQSVLDSEVIRNFYDEIVTCLEIVDDLNLNIRIWGK
ncbi:MAG: DUF3137 domain-containing protein [Chitinophagales bacterium]|nr:DUF3137 domain-containing protein [Chitinophagales bacterium]